MITSICGKRIDTGKLTKIDEFKDTFIQPGIELKALYLDTKNNLYIKTYSILPDDRTNKSIGYKLSMIANDDYIGIERYAKFDERILNLLPEADY